MKLNRSVAGIFTAGMLITLLGPGSTAVADEDAQVDVVAEDAPETLTHQGRLVDDEGEPVVGDVELLYTIWDHPTEGNVLWQDVVDAELDDTGFYSVELGGEDNPIDAAVVADGQGWLGVSVDGDDELDPRISLNAVPYALIAEEALRAGEAGFAAEAGVADEAQIVHQVEEGAIGPEALADDFEVDAEHVEPATGQTLGGMACATGHVAQFDGDSWNCTDSVEHAATAEEADHAETAGSADHADEAASAEIAEDVEDGSIGTEALADGFSLTPDQVDGDTLGGMSCAAGQVARFDGNSWFCDETAGGTVTSVSADGPLTSTGGDDPTIGIPPADADTDGYLSGEDYASFDDRVESVQAGEGVSVTGDAAPEVAVQFGDQPGTAVEGDDERLSDPREPEPGHDHYIQNDPDSPQDASIDIQGDASVDSQLTADQAGIGTDDPDSRLEVDGDTAISDELQVGGQAQFDDDVGIGVDDPDTPLAVDGNTTSHSQWTQQYSVRESEPERLVGPDGEDLERVNGVLKVTTRSTSRSPVRLYLLSNRPGEDWCETEEVDVVSSGRSTGPVVECDDDNYFQVRLLDHDSRDYTVTATMISATELH